MAEVLANEPDAETGFVSRFVTAPDGLRLHVRRYGERGRGLPIVCLPGLTRNGSDFHELATALTADATQPRLVITIDLRGRGRSDHDRNPENYSFPVELADVLAVITALEIGPAIFLGTSRGGILTMLLGAARPAAIAGVILNDIGPVIDSKGLVRIKGYAGKLPAPRSFTEGAEILRRLGDAQFPGLSPESWLRQAQQVWRQENGALVLSYDPKSREDARKRRRRTAPARAVAAVRFTRARSADGRAWRQFRHPFRRDRGRDARAPARYRRAGGAEPGSRAAPCRARRDRPHRGVRHAVRRLGAWILKERLARAAPCRVPQKITHRHLQDALVECRRRSRTRITLHRFARF